MDWIEHDNDGRILMAISCLDEPEAMMGGVVVAVASKVDPTRSVMVDGEALDLGPRPSIRHTLNIVARKWEITVTAQWDEVREKRDALLAASDWVVLRAYEQGVPIPTEWLAYRQALRDITNQADPEAVTWPNIPG